MSDEVIFEEDSLNNRVGNIQIVPGAPTGMLSWLIKQKIVKDGKQAEQFLLGVAVVAVLLSVFFVVYATKIVTSHSQPAPPPIHISAPTS